MVPRRDDGPRGGGNPVRSRWKPRPRLRKWEDRGKRYIGKITDKNRSKKERIGYVAVALAASGAIILFLIFIYALILIPFTPGISELRKAKAERPTTVYSADGEKLVEFKPLNREWVELEDVPEELIEALVATEDHRFYQHHGIDIKRIPGALFHTLTGDTQGGSTITQQLARNLYPDKIGRKRSLTRKLKEMITAFKIEHVYEKDEILQTYLNTVPFLYNAFGIEMAARTYFDKSASDLDLLESATLVGMLKGTWYYNPVRNPERAKERRNTVLRQMVKHGYLEEERYEDLKDEPIELDFERQPIQQSKAPHFTEYVRSWLVDWADQNDYNIYQDSLVVFTTLNMDLQRMAERAIERQLNALQIIADVEWGRSSGDRLSRSPATYAGYRTRTNPFGYFWEHRRDLVEAFIKETPQYRAGVDDGIEEQQMLDSLLADDDYIDSLKEVKTRLETGFVAIDPQTGHVKAWIGSRDYDKDRFDHVARAKRQPGSTFKPFVYAAALEEGFRPDDTLPDVKVEIKLRNNHVWSPENTGSFSGQDLTLTEGLIHSKNSITAQLIDKVGVNDVAKLARDMGVRHSKLTKVPSLALGTSEVTLLEMVTGYATFASGGIYHEPLVVTRIERNGEVIASFEPNAEQVLSEETALRVVEMMRGVIDRGTGQRIRSTFRIDAPVAGKTGTTQNNADGWFILMHPDLVAGTWVGFNDPRVAFRSAYWGQGGNNAVFVVGDFFRRALSEGSIEWREHHFPPAPEYEERRSVFERIGSWFSRTFGGDSREDKEEVEDEQVPEEEHENSEPLIRRVGDWIGSAFGKIWRSLDNIGNNASEENPESFDAAQVPSEVLDGEDENGDPDLDESQREADLLNRLERESNRLDRVLEEMDPEEDDPDDTDPDRNSPEEFDEEDNRPVDELPDSVEDLLSESEGDNEDDRPDDEDRDEEEGDEENNQR